METSFVHSPSVNIADGLRISTYRYPNKTAIIQGDRSLTFRQMEQRTNRVGHALLGLGFVPGDRIAVLLHNCIEYLEIIFGIAKAGMTMVPLNPRLLARELVDQLNDCQAKVLITSNSFTASAQAVLDGCPAMRHGVMIDGVGTAAGTMMAYEDLLSAASNTDHVLTADETSPFFIGYTSGTTGRPKGVVVSHRSRAVNMLAMAAEYGCYSPEDISLAVAPLYHGAGLSFNVAPFFFGGTVVLMPRFDALEVLRLMASGVTNTFLVPTMFHAIFALGKEVIDQYPAPKLHTILSNASALPQATKEKIVATWPGAGLHELYGSTEAGIVTNLRPADQLRKDSCVGHPYPFTDVKLLDDDGNEVAVGEVGELYSRSPYIFSGYLNQEETTRACFRGDYFSAGDLARRDEDNCFYIVDRKKDMVISGGVNIYPREIEDVLFRHEKIADIAVIGLPHAVWGETLHAVVVPRPGIEIALEELASFCEGRLARYKHPRSMSVLEALPRNASGKVLKRELRVMFVTA